MFTLGKSYLSENHQSYFYIKNDPIKKVITGDNQSAVICGWFGNSILFFCVCVHILALLLSLCANLAMRARLNVMMDG